MSLKSRSSVKDGRLHGVSEGWHTNGQLQVVEHFRDGISEGLRTKWYPNGVRLSQATIVHGQLHGLFRKWREDETLAQEMVLEHGVPHGVSRCFFPSGFLEMQAEQEYGKVVAQQRWKDGEIKAPHLVAGFAAEKTRRTADPPQNLSDRERASKSQERFGAQ